jgi:hypothetical protein
VRPELFVRGICGGGGGGGGGLTAFIGALRGWAGRLPVSC